MHAQIFALKKVPYKHMAINFTYFSMVFVALCGTIAKINFHMYIGLRKKV